MPVSKLVEESGKVDAFYENSEIYYGSLQKIPLTQFITLHERGDAFGASKWSGFFGFISPWEYAIPLQPDGGKEWILKDKLVYI